MNLNIRPSDNAYLAGLIDPDAYAPATLTTGWIHMGTFEQILAVVMAGDLGTTGTVSAKLEQATTSGGAGAKDITGKAITQLTQAASPSESNKQAMIELRSNELDVANGFDYARLSVTVGDTTSPVSATSDLAAFVLGLGARYQPQSQLASVAERIA